MVTGIVTSVTLISDEAEDAIVHLAPDDIGYPVLLDDVWEMNVKTGCIVALRPNNTGTYEVLGVSQPS